MAEQIMDKAPAFQFYPKDWLTDPDVVCMSMAQKGAYITLICYCWKEDKLPNNPDYIRKLLGNVPKWKTLWNGIKHKFEIQGDYLVHPRLEKEKLKQEEYRLKKSIAGKIGMEKRWSESGNNHNTVKEVLITKNNSSSSSSSSNNNIYISDSNKIDLTEFIKDYPRLDVALSHAKYVSNCKEKGKQINTTGFDLWCQTAENNGWNLRPGPEPGVDDGFGGKILRSCDCPAAIWVSKSLADGTCKKCGSPFREP